YLGQWYEIARMPHWFERDMDYVRAEYSRRPDGRIRVVNSGTKDGKEKSATAVAKFKGDHSVGELRVSFFRPFYGDYRILALDQNYTQVIVGSSGKDFLWILARTPTIPQEDLDRHLAQLKTWDYDTTKLEYPRQK
ncbi:MAG: lipocalin family protein, partial [Fibrobacter sp.]|nr:lipocalin family protein [Fibrobacter sp.]